MLCWRCDKARPLVLAQIDGQNEFGGESGDCRYRASSGAMVTGDGVPTDRGLFGFLRQGGTTMAPFRSFSVTILTSFIAASASPGQMPIPKDPQGNPPELQATGAFRVLQLPQLWQSVADNRFEDEVTHMHQEQMNDDEAKAMKFIEKKGGRILRDEKLPGKPIVGVSFADGVIDDAGLKEITVLKSVTGLNLVLTKVTDAGLKEVAKFDNLIVLNLGLTKVTDAGVAELAKLTKLTDLGLQATNITDAGCKEIAKIKTLKNLSLNETRITDKALLEVAKLSELTMLTISNTKISDSGIKTLGKLKKLESLEIYKTKATDSGVADLQKALPACKIEYK